MSLDRPPSHCMKLTVYDSGSGTFGLMERIRALGYKGTVQVLTEEPSGPFDRTKLSKALIADVSKLALRSEDWYSKASVEVIPESVTSIDFSKKAVSTKSGKTYDYTKLVLATGGTPNRLPLPGFKDLKGIFPLRGVGHVQHILNAAPEGSGKNIVIVGSSFIGCEIANALVGKKHKVSVVGMENAPFERVMGEKVGKIFQKNLEKSGVKFYMGASVDSATPSSSDKSTVGGVKLKDGTVLDADVVIEAVGVKPATEYLKDNSAITLEKDGSLKTDKDFAVEGLKDVYAIGDIATYPYHGPGGNGSPVRIEHWVSLKLIHFFPSSAPASSFSVLEQKADPSTLQTQNVAQNGGKHVAALIANPSHPSSKPFQLPIFWSALGAQLRYAGNTAATSGYDTLVLQPEDPQDAAFVAYYGKGDTVVAVATMGKDPVMAKVAELMRRGKMPSVKEIQDGADVLKLDLV